jgi:hypothetical protein
MLKLNHILNVIRRKAGLVFDFIRLKAGLVFDFIKRKAGLIVDFFKRNTVLILNWLLPGCEGFFHIIIACSLDDNVLFVVAWAYQYVRWIRLYERFYGLP